MSRRGSSTRRTGWARPNFVMGYISPNIAAEQGGRMLLLQSTACEPKAKGAAGDQRRLSPDGSFSDMLGHFLGRDLRGLAADAAALLHSRRPWKVTYSIGIRKMPMEVAAIMPANTAVPTRAPAQHRGAVGGDQRHQPEDERDRGHHHGAEPRARAHHAGSRIDMPASRCSLANSTIRMPFLAASAISTTRPICA